MSDTNTEPNSPQVAGCQQEPCCVSSDAPESAQLQLARMAKERDEWRDKAEKLSVTCYTWEDNWKLAVKDISTRKENNFGLHRRNVRLAEALRQVELHDGPGYSEGACAKIAATALSHNAEMTSPHETKTNDMEHQESQPKPEDSANNQTSGDRRLSTCSPSSDTPKTDEAAFDDPMTTAQYVRANIARKLERERDAAVSALMLIEERYIDGCDTYEDWKFMGDTARKFLLENVDVEAREK